MKMKTMSLVGACVALASVALIASPAAAQTPPSTTRGNVKIEVAPQAPKPGDTLTIRFAAPPKPAAENEDDPEGKLKQCGEKWNKKLAAYEAGLPKLKKELAYYRKWENDVAQRPPMPPEPLLTRESYRACMYACLGDRRARCPGGWPDETAEKK